MMMRMRMMMLQVIRLWRLGGRRGGGCVRGTAVLALLGHCRPRSTVIFREQEPAVERRGHVDARDAAEAEGECGARVGGARRVDAKDHQTLRQPAPPADALHFHGDVPCLFGGNRLGVGDRMLL
eukprot:1026147-Rhodomonas_salina.3